MGLFLSLITPHKSVSKHKGIFNLIYGLWGIRQNISPPREGGGVAPDQNASLMQRTALQFTAHVHIFIFDSRLCRSSQARAVVLKTTQTQVPYLIFTSATSLPLRAGVDPA